MNWNLLKQVVTDDLRKAGITDKTAISTILNFERRLNTIENNRRRGVKWRTISTSNTYKGARALLDELNGGGGHGSEDAPLWEYWVKYCKVIGGRPYANMSDFMA